jgi:hypothetical protein
MTGACIVDGVGVVAVCPRTVRGVVAGSCIKARRGKGKR